MATFPQYINSARPAGFAIRTCPLFWQSRILSSQRNVRSRTPDSANVSPVCRSRCARIHLASRIKLSNRLVVLLRCRSSVVKYYSVSVAVRCPASSSRIQHANRITVAERRAVLVHHHCTVYSQPFAHQLLRAGLTLRSSGAPTAGRQARRPGWHIFRPSGLASCRCRPLSSNVRRHKDTH